MNKKLRGLLLQVEVMEGSKIEVLDENTFEVLKPHELLPHAFTPKDTDCTKNK